MRRRSRFAAAGTDSDSSEEEESSGASGCGCDDSHGSSDLDGWLVPDSPLDSDSASEPATAVGGWRALPDELVLGGGADSASEDSYASTPEPGITYDSHEGTVTTVRCAPTAAPGP